MDAFSKKMDILAFTDQCFPFHRYRHCPPRFPHRGISTWKKNFYGGLFQWCVEEGSIVIPTTW